MHLLGPFEFLRFFRSQSSTIQEEWRGRLCHQLRVEVGPVLHLKTAALPRAPLPDGAFGLPPAALKSGDALDECDDAIRSLH